MHRVSALLPSWDRSRQSSPVPTTNTTNKTDTTASSPAPPPPKTPGALTKVFGWAEKIVPAARISISTAPRAPTRYGRETYWPTSLDKECDKAARIIKSFCFDGFLSQDFNETDETDQIERADQADQTAQAGEPEASTTEPKLTPKYVTKKIPPRIIQNAVGLAVFSCMRSGLWMSGSGGAGLITARKADGTCVQTLELFTRPRLVLGADASLAVGPLVADGAQDPEIKWKEISETVLTYVKARGKHQAVRLDGSMVTERVNENEKFYRAGVTILDILAGNIPKNVPQMRPLFEVIKAAEGRSDYDKVLMDWLAQQPAPGDADIESPRESIASITSPTKLAFGVPDANDPDPFGVIGLEMAGIEIREAGSKLRPTSTQFEYQPSPSSPLYGRFSRQSMDTFVSRSNRGSCMSARTQATTLTDACTQSTSYTTFSRPNSDDGKDAVERLPTVMEPEEVDYTQVDTSIIEKLKRRTVEPVAPEPVQVIETKEIKVTEATSTTEVKTTHDEKKPEVASQTVTPPTPIEGPSPKTDDERDEDADDEDDEDEEDEPVVCEVATASAQPARASIQRSQVTQVIQAKGAIVTIPKRIPPPLPPRSPARASRGSRSEYGDVSSLRSPIRNSFLSIESRGDGSRASLDETLATQEPTHPETDQGSPTQSQRPASPRHTKNTSSVCTAVAVNTTSPSRLSSSTIPSRGTHGDERKAEDSNVSPSSVIPPTPQTIEPTSSAEDDSEREPRTPQTTETDFDTASEHHVDAKPLDETKATTGAGVRIVSATSTPLGSASERERERAADVLPVV
ncbi:hypothetical protein B0I37DRAFT_350829 [Chaetomium sp. MPI-CAGE-AT-0009]|nr:hypothetical protein B0I37DRAFT_350829 [Chaetomium sp. MPI-CAGE-AT-0009]